MQYEGYFEMGYYGGYGQQYPGNKMDGYGNDSYNRNMSRWVHSVYPPLPTPVNLLAIDSSAQLKEIPKEARELAHETEVDGRAETEVQTKVDTDANVANA